VIESFLRTGLLGGLSLGQSKDLVRMLLGEPEDYSRLNKTGEIWKYSSLQLTFHEDTLCGIGLYFDEGTVELPRALSVTRLSVEHSRLDHFKDFLRTKSINFIVDRDLTFDDQTCLRISQSNVGVSFTEEQLYSMQNWKTETQLPFSAL
jgi:hypothetical protein